MAAQYAIEGTTAKGIAASVERGVTEGGLAPGDALPPVRRLADDLGVSPGTVATAYKELRHQEQVVVLGGVLGGVQEGVRARCGDARLLDHACVLRQPLARDLAGVRHAYPSPIACAPSDLRPSTRTSACAARHEGHADTHTLSRPPAFVAGRFATVRCGLRHVARSPLIAYHVSGAMWPPIQDIDERSAERPEAVQQSASLPAPVGGTVTGGGCSGYAWGVSVLRPASRKTTERSRSDQSAGSSPTVCRRRLSTV